MTQNKVMGWAYYLGAASTFAAFIGAEAYSCVSCEKFGLEDKIESIVLGIPAITLLPMGIYCIGKSVQHFMDNGKNKK